MINRAWVAPKIRGINHVPIKPIDVELPRHAITVIWFDPGGKTGWSLISIPRNAIHHTSREVLPSICAFSAGEFLGEEKHIVDQMMYLTMAWDDCLYGVGMEGFILRKFSKDPQLLSPVRIIARFEDRMYRAGRSDLLLPIQQPDLAKTSVSDTIQKQWGLWLPGKKDANMATKHAITHLRRLKNDYMPAPR